jgi:hypothetical protein
MTVVITDTLRQRRTRWNSVVRSGAATVIPRRRSPEVPQVRELAGRGPRGAAP